VLATCEEIQQERSIAQCNSTGPHEGNDESNVGQDAPNDGGEG